MSDMTWTQAQRAQKMNPSVIREILKVTEKPGIISFAGGLPSPKTFPVAAFREACDKVLREDGHAALQYAASEGYAPLREMVAAMLPWEVDPAQVLITTGSQQGLDLIAKILIDEGSRVLVETPTYLGALQAFTPMEPEVVGVASDDEGVDIADLASKAAGARFLLRAAQFPEPHRPHHERSAPRRAERRGRAPGPAHRGRQPLRRPVVRHAAAAAADRAQSRGLRLHGLLLQDPGARPAPGLPGRAQVLYPKLLQAKQAADLHTPGFNQRMVVETMKNNFLDRHVPTIRALYKSQRDAMLAAMQRDMPEGVSWNTPAGGMFLWVRLPEGMNAIDLLPKAVERNVAFVPGWAFYADHADIRTLRLSFVTSSVEQINIGIAALAAAIREQLPTGVPELRAAA
jgi:2-aminoadipate transaminase